MGIIKECKTTECAAPNHKLSSNKKFTPIVCKLTTNSDK